MSDKNEPMTDPLTGQTVELLQTLIRNALRQRRHRRRRARRSATPTCCSRSSSDSGLDVQRYEPTPGRARWWRGIEGTDPGAPTPVPDGPHRRRAGEPRRLEPRPVRRRARRRRGVGPWRGRHAQPHRVDGGRVPAPRPPRLPPAGDLIYFAVADEESGQRARCAVDGRPRARRDPCRLRAHRERRAPLRTAGGAVRRRQRRREGRRLAPAARARHTRPRLGAVPQPTTRS